MLKDEITEILNSRESEFKDYEEELIKTMTAILKGFAKDNGEGICKGKLMVNDTRYYDISKINNYFKNQGIEGKVDLEFKFSYSDMFPFLLPTPVMYITYQFEIKK